MDVLIKWDLDGSENVVSEAELIFLDGKKTNGKVKMWWKPDNSWWTGTILMYDRQSPEDSNDDVPLAKIARKAAKELEITNEMDESELTSAASDADTDADAEYEDDNSVIDKDYIPSDSEEDETVQTDGKCERLECKQDIFAACHRCLKMLCYDHFLSICVFCTGDKSVEPENFEVEGVPKEPLKELSPQKSRANTVKVARNAGLQYYTEKTNNFVEARNYLKPRCSSEKCQKRGLLCKRFTEDRRQQVLQAYYGIPDVTQKRSWLTAHVIATSPNQATAKSRKSRTLHYYLPNEDGELLQVCRVMFLATANISERQIKTALDKLSTEGIVEAEKRGGRHDLQKNRDAEIREICRSHINQFPKTESHYCRKKSNYEYISGELSVKKMYDMFTLKTGRKDISLTTYYRVFKSLKIKFNKPKKDQCGLCESFRNADEKQRTDLEERYKKHISEKEAVRRLKDLLKNTDDPSHIIASFDLQQVIYLPKSNRCEVFYKRRLSNYDFTVYNLKTKDVNCYLWNESLAARGSNEISSCVHHFLKGCDRLGITKVSLFADGCSGQNKNSILPVMLQEFVRESRFINEVSVFYFETNHGQNEGDSVHSTIERAVRRAGEVILPSQLAMLIRLARREPYSVIEVHSDDIMDWKAYSQQLGILRVRVSEEGENIDWPSVMQLKVEKSRDLMILFKLSHLQSAFFTLNLRSRRNSSTSLLLEKAYNIPPKVSHDKFTDLQALCSGDTPVITTEEARTFYRSLPH